MTEAATENAVAVIRAQLTAAQSAAAAARGRAELAADALRLAPSVDGVEVRDRTRALVEVADLEVERLKRDLAEGLERERQAAIEAVLASAGEVQSRAAAADAEMWVAIEAQEAAIQRMLAARQELRRLNGKLVALNYADGYQDSLQVAVRSRAAEYDRRLTAARSGYGKFVHPLFGPVARS